MPESIGDLVALFLCLILLWLIPGRLSGGERGTLGSRHRLKAR